MNAMAAGSRSYLKSGPGFGNLKNGTKIYSVIIEIIERQLIIQIIETVRYTKREIL